MYEVAMCSDCGTQIVTLNGETVKHTGSGVFPTKCAERFMRKFESHNG